MYLVSYRKYYRENLWNEITVNEEGVASAVCMFSRPRMPIRNLGHFRHELAPHKTVKIQDCVMRNSLHKKSVISTLPLAGRKLASILVLNDARRVEHSWPRSGPTPEELVEFEHIMMETMKEVGNHPLRAFNIHSRFSFSSVIPGEHVEIEFQMNNHGRLPVKTFNPNSARKPVRCSLNFLVWMVRYVAAGRDTSEYYTTFQTNGIEFKISSHKVFSSDQDYLYFMPGEKLVSKIDFRFPKYEAGHYQFQLVYVSLSDFGKDIELLSGAYHGDPVNVEVLGFAHK